MDRALLLLREIAPDGRQPVVCVAIPVSLRVRMACSIGPVIGSLMEASETFADELAG
jgi:hypothetical protein